MATVFNAELLGSGFRTELIDLGDVSGNIWINVNQGNEFLIHPVGNTKVYFNGLPPAGQVGYWSLEIRSPGSYSVSFMEAVTFDTDSGTLAGGTQSTVFAFRCRDGQRVAGGTSYASIPG